MSTPTTSAVPSASPLDLLFNAEKIDEAVNSTAPSYLDRFGLPKRTLAGAAASISAVNPRGAWAATTTYIAKDVVSNSGTWYIALDNHVAGATFAGDLSAHWRVYQGVVAPDLADTSSDFNGAGMVGYKQVGTGAAVRTALAKFRESISVLDYLRADLGEDAAVDIGPALQRALDYIATQVTTHLTSSGFAIKWPSRIYRLATSVTVAAGCHGVAFASDGGKGALVYVATAAKITVGDVTHAVPTYRFNCIQMTFVAESTSATTSTCFEMHRTPEAKFIDNLFNNFNLSIDGYRLNESQIRSNKFYASGRITNPITAFVRLQGVAAGETGGGLHIKDNEFVGNGNDSTMVAACVKAHTGDGLYVRGNHFVFYTEGVRLETLATAANNTITDVWINALNYFDQPAAGGFCIRMTGTVGSGGALGTGYYQKIRVHGNHFRGAYMATNLIRIDIADDGTFAAAGRKVKNIDISLGNTLEQAVSTAVQVQGNSSGKLEVYGLRTNENYLEDNNQGGAATVSGFSAEAESWQASGNHFEADNQPAAHLISGNLSLPPSNDPAFTAHDNDCAHSNCTDDPVSWTVIAGSRVSVKSNHPPGDGQEVQQSYRFTTTDRSPRIAFQRLVHADGQLIALTVCAIGASTSGTAVSERARYEMRATIYRQAGGSATVNALTSIVAYENVTNNNAPVVLTLLTGTAWSASAAVSAGDMITSGGNVYLVLLAGNLDGTNPPVHTSGVATNGTATLGFVSATAPNTVALICAGAPSTDMSWIAREQWESLP